MVEHSGIEKLIEYFGAREHSVRTYRKTIAHKIGQ